MTFDKNVLDIGDSVLLSQQSTHLIIFIHTMGEEAEKKPDTGAVEHINLKVVGQVKPYQPCITRLDAC